MSEHIKLSRCFHRHEVILDFIYRIQKEVSFYANDGKWSNVDEIESRLQANRMKNIFQNCIQYVKFAFSLPYQTDLVQLISLGNTQDELHLVFRHCLDSLQQNARTNSLELHSHKVS